MTAPGSISRSPPAASTRARPRPRKAGGVRDRPLRLRCRAGRLGLTGRQAAGTPGDRAWCDAVGPARNQYVAAVGGLRGLPAPRPSSLDAWRKNRRVFSDPRIARRSAGNIDAPSSFASLTPADATPAARPSSSRSSANSRRRAASPPSACAGSRVLPASTCWPASPTTSASCCASTRLRLLCPHQQRADRRSPAASRPADRHHQPVPTPRTAPAGPHFRTHTPVTTTPRSRLLPAAPRRADP